MVLHPRNKGNRSVQRAVVFYTKKGWLVDKVEKTGKWVFIKDLYGLFDLIGIKKNKVLLIQVKTNNPPTQKDYKDFAKKYAGRNVLIQAFTWYDRVGPVTHKFYSNGTVVRDDYRK